MVNALRTYRPVERGATLATTIVALGLCLLLILAMSTVSITHLRQTTQQVKRQFALNAAEAVLAEATERLVTEPEFGLTRTEEQTSHFAHGNGKGLLTFSNDRALSDDIPFSTSNRFGLEPISGWNGTIVPPFSVQLIGVGESDGVEVVVETILRAPEFPYVIASSGPVDSEGALTIGLAQSLEDITAVDLLRPSAITSDGLVEIRGQAKVVGNIESSRDVLLGPAVKVRGEVRPNSHPIQLEDLEISSLRPTAGVPIPTNSSPVLSGHYYHNGPNLVISGGLKLDDAVLYVNGDAVIRGGVQGKGAVITNGGLTLDGASSLQASTQVALVSQGDLRVSGNGQNSSFFQGLVYTEGDFYAEDVTLVGAFAANKQTVSPTEPGSRVRLKDSRLIQYPEYATFDLDSVPFLLWGGANKESQGGRETLYLLQVDRRDMQVLYDAVKLTESTTQGGEGNGGTMPDGGGGVQMVLTVNIPPVVAVTRGRAVEVENGKLVSDWRELDAAQVSNLVHGVQVPNTGSLSLLGFEADPSSLFWEIVEASLHLDLNEFLGSAARLRLSSWQLK